MLTKEQKLAIKRLERAFAVCAKNDLFFVGMDSELKYGTKTILYKYDNTAELGYNGIAYACKYQGNGDIEVGDEVGKVNTRHAYLDSGGF